MNKFSILLYLGILLFSSQTILLVSAKEEGECSSSVLDEDPSCPSRDHIIRCAGEYMDTNKNKKLERSELEAAIDTLPWYGKGILKILGSVDKIMVKCDADGDGAISLDHDMPATTETCLSTCFKKKAFKGAFFPDCCL